MEGLGRTLARKFYSNSLASWSKDETEDGAQLVEPCSCRSPEGGWECPTHQGIRGAIEGHLSPKCGNVLYGIRAVVVHLQRQQPEVEGYRLVLYFLSKGGFARATFARLTLQLLELTLELVQALVDPG